MERTSTPNFPEILKFALVICGAFFVSAAVGAFVTGSKSHKELMEDERKRREEEMKQQREQQGFPPGDFDQMRGEYGGPQQGQEELTPEDEKQLFNLFQTAMYLKQSYQLEKAAYYFQVLLELGSKIRSPLVDRIMPQFLINAYSSLVDSGKFDDAKMVIQAYPRPLEMSDRLKITEELISLLTSEEDPSTVTLIESIINGLAEIQGSFETAEVQKYFCKLSLFLRRIGSFDDAINESLKAIEIGRKLQPPETTLSKDLLFSYLCLQASFINQGYVAKAEEIEAELEKECDPFDITFNWHLTHLAMIYVESDYDSYAEKYWKRVIGRFQDFSKFLHYPKPEFNRIVSLVANSMNELGVMYFNQFKIKSYEEIREIIAQNRWQLNTGSKYFETKAGAWTQDFDEKKNDWSGSFVILLKLKSGVAPGMVLSVSIDHPSGDEEWDVSIPHPHSIFLKSSPRKDFLPRTYTAKIRLYSNATKDELLSTHIQTIQCGLDTRGVNTLQDFMEKFAQKKDDEQEEQKQAQQAQQDQQDQQDQQAPSPTTKAYEDFKQRVPPSSSRSADYGTQFDDIDDEIDDDIDDKIDEDDFDFETDMTVGPTGGLRKLSERKKTETQLGPVAEKRQAEIKEGRRVLKQRRLQPPTEESLVALSDAKKMRPSDPEFWNRVKDLMKEEKEISEEEKSALQEEIIDHAKTKLQEFLRAQKNLRSEIAEMLREAAVSHPDEPVSHPEFYARCIERITQIQQSMDAIQEELQEQEEKPAEGAEDAKPDSALALPESSESLEETQPLESQLQLEPLQQQIADESAGPAFVAPILEDRIRDAYDLKGFIEAQVENEFPDLPEEFSLRTWTRLRTLFEGAEDVSLVTRERFEQFLNELGRERIAYETLVHALRMKERYEEWLKVKDDVEAEELEQARKLAEERRARDEAIKQEIRDVLSGKKKPKPEEETEGEGQEIEPQSQETEPQGQETEGEGQETEPQSQETEPQGTEEGDRDGDEKKEEEEKDEEAKKEGDSSVVGDSEAERRKLVWDRWTKSLSSAPSELFTLEEQERVEDLVVTRHPRPLPPPEKKSLEVLVDMCLNPPKPRSPGRSAPRKLMGFQRIDDASSDEEPLESDAQSDASTRERYSSKTLEPPPFLRSYSPPPEVPDIFKFLTESQEFDEPEDEPQESVKPEESDKPEESYKPEESDKHEESDKPEESYKPEESDDLAEHLD